MTYSLKIDHFLGIFFSSLNKVRFFQDSTEYHAYYYTADFHAQPLTILVHLIQNVDAHLLRSKKFTKNVN